MIKIKCLKKAFEKTQTISVIVPVYNVAPYIERCVDSLIKQTYPRIEIILIDDGSTDNSGVIADEIAQIYSNIIVIHQENRGVSAARNTGLRRATGSYIGFVDPDDYVDKEMYDYLYEAMVTHDADVAACTFVNEYEYCSKKVVQSGMEAVLSSEDAVTQDLFQGMYITCNKLFSRKVCYNLYYDERIINGEDRLFDVQSLLQAERVVYVNKPFYHYYHRLNSAGTKKYTKKDASLIIACQEIKELVKKRNEKLQNIAELQLVKAYIQLITMMDNNVDKYLPDGREYLREIRKSLWVILGNPEAGIKIKLKVFVMCFPFYFYKLIMKVLVSIRG